MPYTVYISDDYDLKETIENIGKKLEEKGVRVIRGAQDGKRDQAGDRSKGLSEILCGSRGCPVQLPFPLPGAADPLVPET